MIKSHDGDLGEITSKKKKITKDVEETHKQFINQMSILKNEYDDIIREVVPNQMMGTFDFKKSNDIKTVKNYLKKSFQRLGMLGDFKS